MLPTLVLLPGMDGTGALFRYFVAALPGETKLVLVRYPESAALGYEALEHSVRKALPESEPFILVAESFSGPLAIAVAAAEPPGLCGLVLCCTFASNPRPGLRWLQALLPALPVKRMPVSLLGWFLMGRHASDELREELAMALSGVSADALRARVRAVLSVDVTERLRQVSVPVLYLQATDDLVVPSIAAAQIASALPSAKILKLDGPHFLLQTAAKAASSAIEAFADQLGSGSGSTGGSCDRSDPY